MTGSARAFGDTLRADRLADDHPTIAFIGETKARRL
jgi:hypothetical protein